MSDFTIVHDDAYTTRLNEKIVDKYGPKDDRPGLHATDLIMCLRKAWAKKHIPTEQQTQVSEDTILTWSGGLIFEDLISTGEKQKQAAYCFHCLQVSSVIQPEPVNCPVCNHPWIIFTPDYIDEEIIHEVKQTRKSSRKGPENAPWWIDQLRTYLLFARRAGWTDTQVTRLVVNWLMGDYGSKKKGEIPRPPQSTLDAYLVIFNDGFENDWELELQRRAQVVLGEDMPMLKGMGEEFGSDGLSPQYDWECASCPVGDIIDCELRKQWDVVDEKEVVGDEE
ncbi:hypothetical protein LCGC14_0310900 [marine sediment metagenome]|uniref:PD-(D/E)XK endonuclease-like domain-containing protein n=1 Tax=marine sediment metagenome TaxID=412755 RepID=A0A0F9U4U1_9ZZZZ